MSFTQHKDTFFPHVRSLSFSPPSSKGTLLSIALCGVSLAAFAHTADAQTAPQSDNTLISNNGTIYVNTNSPNITSTVSGSGGLTVTGDGSLPNSPVYGVWGQNIDISGINGDSTQFKSLTGTPTLTLGGKTLVLNNGTAQKDSIPYLSQTDNSQPVDSSTYRGWAKAGTGGITIANGTEALYGYNKSYSGNTTINQGGTLLLGPLINGSVISGDVSKGLLQNSAIVNSGTVQTFIPQGLKESGNAYTMVQNNSITNTSTGVLDLGDGLNAKGGITNNGGSVTLRDDARTTAINSTGQAANVTLNDTAHADSIKQTDGAVTLNGNANASTVEISGQTARATLTGTANVMSSITNTDGTVSLNGHSTTPSVTSTGKTAQTFLNDQATVTGTLTNRDGNVALQGGSQAAAIDSAGDNTSVSLSSGSQADSLTSSGNNSKVLLDKGNVTGLLHNTNGQVTLQNGSQVGTLTSDGKNGYVSVDNSTVTGAVTNQNGTVFVQNGSQVGAITSTGDHASVALLNSTSHGTVSNENGDVGVNHSTVQGDLRNKNGQLMVGDSTVTGALSNANGGVTLTNASVGQTLQNANGLVSLDGSTVNGALTNQNGPVTLRNGSQVGSITNTGDHASVALDHSTANGDVSSENGDATLNSATVKGTLSNKNGALTLTNNSQAGDLSHSGDNTAVTINDSHARSLTNTGKNTSVSLNNGTLDGALNSQNGPVVLQNGSQVGSITNTGDHASVALDHSTANGDVSNKNGAVTLGHSAVGGALDASNGPVSLENSSVAGTLTNANGDISLKDNSQAGDIVNSGDHTSVTLSNSHAASLTNSGQNTTASLENATLSGALRNAGGSVTLTGASQAASAEGAGVSLSDTSRISGTVTSANGPIILKDQTQAGAIESSGPHASVALLDHARTGTLNSANGPVTLQGDVHAETINSHNGDVSLTQGASAGALSLDHSALTLDKASVSGTVSASGIENTLLIGPNGATIGTLDLSNGGFSSKTLQGNLTIDTLNGNFDRFIGSRDDLTIKNANSNTVTLADNNAYSQTKTITNGTVSIGNGATNGVITGTLTVSGHIILNNHTDTTQSGTLGGYSDLTQESNVTTTLTGDNSYTGSTTIKAGALEVDGNQSAATGTTFMDANTRLSGQGTLGGSVSMAENATLAPGNAANPLASLTVNKDLTMDKGSTLVINAASEPTGTTITDDAGLSYSRQQSSSVNVKGTARFNDNNFRLHVSGDPTVRYGQAYVIATSDHPIQVADINQATQNIVANSNLIQHSSFVSPVLKNIKDPVLALVGERNSRSFSEAGTTRNTVATGLGLDAVPMAQGVAQTFAAMNIPEARSHLGAFSGEVHASVRTALIQDSVYVRQAALDRLDSADCDGSASNGISTASLKTGRKTSACLSEGPVLWGRALGSLGHNSGDGNAATMHHSTAGFVMGLDAPVYDTWRVGGLISYGHSMFNIGSGLSSSGRSDNVSIGGYAGRHWGNLHLRLGAAYTWNIMGMHRTAMAGSFSDRLSSNYMGGTAQGFGELAYKVHLGHKSLIEPFANVAYVNQQTDRYREHGGSAALAGKAMNTGVTFATFGARASTNVTIGRTLFTPHGSLAYRHAFGLTTPSVHQAFAASGARTGMNVGGVPLSQDSAVIDTGVSAKLSDRINVDLSYIGQYGNQSVDSGAQASVKTSF